MRRHHPSHRFDDSTRLFLVPPLELHLQPFLVWKGDHQGWHEARRIHGARWCFQELREECASSGVGRLPALECQDGCRILVRLEGLTTFFTNVR